MPFKGFRHALTQYYPPAPAFTETQAPPGSQAGRVFIVTGGNSGIGFELCRLLYRAGATVYMASRSEAKAEAAIKTIVEDKGLKSQQQKTTIPQTVGTLRFLQLDLDDLASVKQAAAAFAGREPRLDVLWNNAGLGANRVTLDQRTKQGLEPMIGTHCVATLLFTVLLLPQLRAAAAAEKEAAVAASGAKAPPLGRTRVLWTASGLAESSPPNGIDLAKLDAGHASLIKNYSVSKAATWILGREFARRHSLPDGDGIGSFVLNPGNLRAGSWEGTPAALVWVLDKLVLHDTIYGAYTELYAGLSPDLTLARSGEYVLPWGRALSDDKVIRKDILKAAAPEDQGGLGYGSKLWEWCEAKWKPHV